MPIVPPLSNWAPSCRVMVAEDCLTSTFTGSATTLADEVGERVDDEVRDLLAGADHVGEALVLGLHHEVDVAALEHRVLADVHRHRAVRPEARQQVLERGDADQARAEEDAGVAGDDVHVVVDRDVVGEDLQVIEGDVAADDAPSRGTGRPRASWGRSGRCAAGGCRRGYRLPVEGRRQRLDRDRVGPLDGVDAQGLPGAVTCRGVERDGRALELDLQAARDGRVRVDADRVVEDRPGDDRVDGSLRRRSDVVQPE